MGDKNCAKNGAPRTPTEGEARDWTTCQWVTPIKNKERITLMMVSTLRNNVIENDYRVKKGMIGRTSQLLLRTATALGEGAPAVNMCPSHPERRGDVISAWKYGTAPVEHALSNAQTSVVLGGRRKRRPRKARESLNAEEGKIRANTGRRGTLTGKTSGTHRPTEGQQR